MAKPNTRRRNGNARNKLRAWLRSQGQPCWICREFGRDGTIDYSLPAGHPLAFEVDELIPVSRGGDPLDRNNVAAAHRCCNQWRGNKPVEVVRSMAHGRDCQRAKGTTSREW